MKKGDKLYLITRADLSPGRQAVMMAHALREFTQNYPEIDRDWYTTSNYIAALAVPDVNDLTSLFETANSLNLAVAPFYEPDFNDELSAIAIQPSSLTVNLCKKLPLALQ